MKGPLYKKADLGFVTPKKKVLKKAVKKAVKKVTPMNYKHPKYKPSTGKGVGY